MRCLDAVHIHDDLPSWPADSVDGYEYMGFYPSGSPRYDNNFCRDSFAKVEKDRILTRQLPIPVSDLVHGVEGPVVQIWREVDETYKRDVFRVQEAARILCG